VFRYREIGGRLFTKHCKNSVVPLPNIMTGTKLFFQYFLHNLPPISLLQTTTVCETQGVFTLLMSPLEMPECRNTGENVSPASLVLPLVLGISPASAFRHQLQFGTAGHGLVR
jgi:hypothetical protein